MPSFRPSAYHCPGSSACREIYRLGGSRRSERGRYAPRTSLANFETEAAPRPLALVLRPRRRRFAIDRSSLALLCFKLEHGEQRAPAMQVSQDGRLDSTPVPSNEFRHCSTARK